MRRVRRNRLRVSGNGLWLATVFIACIALLFHPHWASAQSGTKMPIKIGVAISLTGKWARTGELEVGGYKLWGKIINERGCSFGEAERYGCKGPGLLGRPVEFIVYDDKSDPSEAVKLIRKLVVSDKVDLILGPYGSAVSNAIAPLAETYRIPVITPLANAPVIWQGKKRQWFVGVLPPAWKNLYGSMLIGKDKGAKTVAFIYSDTAFPTGATRPLVTKAKEMGIKVVLDEAYPKETADWEPIMSKAWSKRPDMILGGGYLPDSIGIVKAAKAVNATPKIFGFLVGPAIVDFAKSLKKDALYITGETFWEPFTQTPGNQEFYRAYTREYNSEPSYHAAAGFAAGQILEMAVKEVGSIEDRKAIRDKLYSMEVTTIFGKYQVNPLGHPDSGYQIGKTTNLIQWQEAAGKKLLPNQVPVEGMVKEIIYPKETATAEVIYPFPGWKNR
ncbi:MAG: amino acid ABC transporter substrate-binding protein [Deltaproteobacteria bacterium]|nr:amino acid ABC transporter substrate-binding protein [Deltaproteobacteria bacterium]